MNSKTIIKLLFLLVIVSFSLSKSYAADKQQAYATCASSGYVTAGIATCGPNPNSGVKSVCAFSKTSGAPLQCFAYTVVCNDPNKTFNETTRTCDAVPQCNGTDRTGCTNSESCSLVGGWWNNTQCLNSEPPCPGSQTRDPISKQCVLVCSAAHTQPTTDGLSCEASPPTTCPQGQSHPPGDIYSCEATPPTSCAAGTQPVVVRRPVC